MTGFFQLEGRDDEQKEAGNSSLFLFRNEEIYNNKGFEIWPNTQYYLAQQNPTNIYSFAVGPSGRETCSISNDNNNVSDESTRRSGFSIVKSGPGLGSGMNCQDCGNQAKKDCCHLRCRTCCKSRGFHCATHVKSTWVPAAKRRERQQQLVTLKQPQQQPQEPHQPYRGESFKRHKELAEAASASLASAPLPISTTGLDLDKFPAQVSSPAVFRCVKVSAMDTGADEQFAYHTAVTIGGHVFKGILYDQGPASSFATGGDQSPCSTGADAQLNLISATTRNKQMAMLDPSLYSASLNAFMAGTQFFPPPRS